MNRQLKSVSLQPAIDLMQWYQYILTLIFSGLCGWLTVYLIIKILFWPERPITLLGFKFQGMIPKNQAKIAQQLGKFISKEFLSFSILQNKVADPGNLDKLKPEIEYHLDHFLREKLKESFPMLSMFIGDKTINQLKSAFLMELESLFPVIMKSYLTSLENDINPEELIAGKIEGFSFKDSGIFLNRTLKKLFTRLQFLGMLIGLLLGLLQVFLLMQLT